MVLKFLLLIFLAPFFGAFEVMIPLGIIAMLVGMMSGMAAVHGGVPFWCIPAAGGIIGFVVAVLIYLANNKRVRPI